MASFLNHTLDRLSRVRPLWVLCGGWVVITAVTVLWVIRDTGICPPTDSEHHLFNAILYSRTLHLGGLPALWELLRTTYVGWPPASYLLLYGPLSWAISDNAHMVRIYGVVLIPVILWGTYYIGTRFGSRRDGTLAALLTLFSFGISGQLRQVSIDLPATAAVLTALAALVSTRQFRRTNETLLFGAAIGLCLFTRVQAVFFLAPPVAGWFVVAMVKARDNKIRLNILARLFLAALISLAVSSAWWAGNTSQIWRAATSHLDASQVIPRGDPSFLAGVWYYCASMGRLCGWPIFIAAFALVPSLLHRRPPGSFMLLLWLAGGLIGCSLGVHREPRYMLPAVAPLVLLTVLTLRTVRPWVYRAGAALLLLGTVLPTFYLANHGLPSRHPLIRSGVLEWGYTRRPYYLKAKGGTAEISDVLRSANPEDKTGASIYLLFVQEQHVNYVPRLGSMLVTMFPDMAYAYSFNNNIVNNRWNLKLRRKRKIYFLTETKRVYPKLKLLWEAKAGRFGNPTPLRIYRLPPGHKWQGRINFYELHWGEYKPGPAQMKRKKGNLKKKGKRGGGSGPK